MKLRERRKLRLDDPVGQYVKGLHPQVAETTIAQLLSHSAGLTRDGADSGQFIDTPALSQREGAAGGASVCRPPSTPNTRFKYSNHGFGLLGLVIEAITEEPYRVWIKREIVDAAGLRETDADMPLAKGAPFARGHTPRLPLGRRLVIPGDNPDPRDDAGRGLRQHGGRHRPLLRATGAQCEAERAFRRQPPRDDAQALAQSACKRWRAITVLAS